MIDRIIELGYDIGIKLGQSMRIIGYHIYLYYLQFMLYCAISNVKELDKRRTPDWHGDREKVKTLTKEVKYLRQALRKKND